MCRLAFAAGHSARAMRSARQASPRNNKINAVSVPSKQHCRFCCGGDQTELPHLAAAAGDLSACWPARFTMAEPEAMAKAAAVVQRRGVCPTAGWLAKINALATLGSHWVGAHYFRKLANAARPNPPSARNRRGASKRPTVAAAMAARNAGTKFCSLLFFDGSIQVGST